MHAHPPLSPKLSSSATAAHRLSRLRQLQGSYAGSHKGIARGQPLSLQQAQRLARAAVGACTCRAGRHAGRWVGSQKSYSAARALPSHPQQSCAAAAAPRLSHRPCPPFRKTVMARHSGAARHTTCASSMLRSAQAPGSSDAEQAMSAPAMPCPATVAKPLTVRGGMRAGKPARGAGEWQGVSGAGSGGKHSRSAARSAVAGTWVLPGRRLPAS